MGGSGDEKRDSDGAPATLSSPPPTAPVAAPYWLSRTKVTVPERVVGYVPRPALLDRVEPTGHRITVLKAPAGFGKTVLLAESCRNLRSAGTMAAWLTLDANDAPQTLDAYVAFAFEQAGMDVVETLNPRETETRRRPGFLDYRIGLLGVAVERHGAACVLVLDELERLDASGSLELLNLLLSHGPPNLHILAGCRELPVSVDVASRVLDGSGRILSSEDLRFSRSDVARFLGAGVSRRRVDVMAQESRGWPIALRVLGNERSDALPGSANAGMDLADNWMESRLLRGLSENERDLLLDAGLFDWIDAGLLDEALGRTDALRTLEAVPALTGLFESVRLAAADARRLHGLVRELCARRRLRETPGRFRRIHRSIAVALGRRGETVLAMRHAAEAADEALVGDILEAAGGVWLWAREGLAPLQAADRLLTAALVARRPRLALARCLVALLTGRPQEAKTLYGSVVGHPEAASHDGAGDPALECDDAMVRGMMVLYGCQQVNSADARRIIADETRFVADDQLDPVMRSSFETGLCIAHNLWAEFDVALDWGLRALRGMPSGHFLEVYHELQRGQIAMARGEVSQAARGYGGVLRKVRASYLRDPDATALAQTLLAELNLERNRLEGIHVASGGAAAHFEGANTFVGCAARAGIALDVTREREGIPAALATAEDLLDYARATARPLLVRLLAAERVSLFVVAGRVDEAERAWRLDGLPGNAEQCLDLQILVWREMEAVACARLRLLTAQGKFEEGRRFLDEWIAIASARDLWRTRMRAAALGVVLARTAGCPGEEERRLDGFLRLFAQADYARPLVRERDACLPALEAFVGNRLDSPRVDDARRLLAMFSDADGDERTRPAFSHRELEVLQQLESHTDKDIARSLSLTPRGVRYHLENIFGKLDVRNRRAAVRRAREMGLLP